MTPGAGQRPHARRMARDKLPPLFRDPLGKMLANTTAMLVLFTVAYFVLPLRYARSQPLTWFSLAASVAALVVVAWLFRANVRYSRRTEHERYLRIQWLLTALYGLVLVFAIIYAAFGTYTDQFDGIDDRVDALYFAVTVASTVGFGDIHPTGNAARLFTTAHMIFNLIYLGTALRVITGPASFLPALPEDEVGRRDADDETAS
jgi:voltage-gated potassium channel